MDARDSFLDVRGKLRPEAKRLRAVLPSLADQAVLAVAEAVIGYHLGRWSETSFAKLVQASGLGSEQLETLFGGLLVVARAAARSRLAAKELAKDLENDLKMAPTAAAAVSAAFAKLQKVMPGDEEEHRAGLGLSRCVLCCFFFLFLLKRASPQDGVAGGGDGEHEQSCARLSAVAAGGADCKRRTTAAGKACV